MKRNKLIASVFTAVVAVFVLSSFTPQDGKKKGEAWDIPEKYQKMENPYAGDTDIIKYGKANYMRHCRSCHGNTGLGDGPKARNLEYFPGDFTSEEFKAIPVGKLYYMSIIGRGEMPNYESKIPEEEDRWALIMYIRTME